jgi:thioesterase domain-containing protein
MDTLEKRIDKLTPNQRKLLEQKMSAINTNKSKILLSLQAGDISKRRPIFCFHPPLGVTGYYLNIVRHLNPEQPVYGIQSPAFYNIRDPFDSMEEMAAYYLDAIRTIQPEPPYAFMAHSSGSMIAYEMALQLKDHLNNIPLLILIDQPAPIGPLDEVMGAFMDPNLTESDEALFLTTWLVSLIHNQELTFTIVDLKSLSSLDQKYELVADFLKQAGFISKNTENDMVKTILQMIANHTIAEAKYREKYTPDVTEIKYEGRTVLMRCTEETFWKGFDLTSPIDTSDFSGWEKFCSGPIDVIGIPDADHISMVLEEHCVKNIAEKLQPYLDKITPIA